MEQNTTTKVPDVSSSNALYAKAQEIIPAATMLLSKRPELFAPGTWPTYYKRAWGSKIEDVDGNVYTDFVGDVGATMLGRADPDVNAAVHAAVDQGNICTQNYPGEIELAELLVGIIPCAEQVRFARGGGEADMVAIRIARGHTRKDLVAFCGYHGWHDWYLAANLADDSTLDGHLLPGLRPLGVPRQLSGTTLPFEFNHLQSLKELLESQPGKFAAIIMEATRHHPPEKGFLEGVRELANEHNAVLIFDEVVTGFRMSLGGAQEYFGVTPDMATFAKTMSNGYPMAAIVGKKDIMQIVDEQFISSTYWTDAIGTAAALATIKKIRRIGAIDYVWELGKLLVDGLNEAIAKSGIPAQVQGWPPLTILAFQEEDPDVVAAMKTLFVRRQLSRGFLASSMHYIMASHTRNDVEKYLSAVEKTMAEIKRSLDNHTLMEDIEFRPSRPLFKRLA
ncbi:MAG: aminotransferase class III-fold pyridoxal phosphate-dependent enzyme [Phycisphaerae bacterium]|nr:aminotransferase class III-fold pyridoxal phosphate-dependent enzyme [Phycisphaerae bacterium]